MIRNYLKIAWRNLRKRRGTSLINIVGLATGFACAILIYLFVSFHLSFDNFHSKGDRIYRFVTDEQRDIVEHEASVPPGFAGVIRNDFTFAEKVARFAQWQDWQISFERDGQPVRLLEDVSFAEADLFDIFDIPLLRGNVEALREPNTALLTEAVAQRIFGPADPVGQTFELQNSTPIRVVGILAPRPKNSVVRSELMISYPTLEPLNSFLGSETWGGISTNMQCFALFYPNQDVTQVEASLQPLPDKYRPNSPNRHLYKVQPLNKLHLDGRYGGGINPRVLWIVSLIGFFVLLIACINYINISTAQSAYRSKEVGVRKVMGSFRSQLLAQFLTEVFVLTAVSLAAGLGLAWLALPYFNETVGLELNFGSLYSLPFMGFLAAIVLGVTFLAGFYPGLVLGRIAPVLAIKRQLSQKTTGGLRIRQVLVTVQFVISMALIASTLVVAKQINYAVNSDLGYNTSVIMVPIASEIDPGRLEALRARLEASTAIESASSCLSSPGAPDNTWGTSIRYDNRPEPEEFSIQVKMADEAYLKTFDLNLVAGRNFYVKRDTVDEALVNRAFGSLLGISDPETLLGKEVQVGTSYMKARIVGVIEDFHDQDFKSRINPIFIAPVPETYSEIALKVAPGRIPDALAHIEKEWKDVFPNNTYRYTFLDERVAEQYQSEQEFLALGKVFSLLAILIGCLGIYGLVSFFVVQKTKEIGIRKVLGGSMGDIIRLFTKDFLKLILLAGLIAVPVAWYAMDRWLRNYQYRTPLEWWVFTAAVGGVLLLTMGIIIYQAARAARANPVNSLRTE